MSDVFSNWRRHNTKRKTTEKGSFSVRVREGKKGRERQTLTKSQSKILPVRRLRLQDRDHGQSCTNKLQGAPQQVNIQPLVPSTQPALLSSFTTCWSKHLNNTTLIYSSKPNKTTNCKKKKRKGKRIQPSGKCLCS